MAAEKQDQRSTQRFALKLPVAVKYFNGGVHEIAAETKNVSARGVFFDLDMILKEGATIEFTLTLPPEITLTDSIRVRCKGKVVRVDHPQHNEKVGIAAAIDQYDFVAES